MRVEATLSFSCSFGVTSRTLLGDMAPGETGAGEEVLLVEVIGPAPLPPVAAATPATPSMPRTFSTALLSPLVQGSRLTSPTPAERLAESRRLDSACRAWRFSSRRGPGPQSCEQPAVAQPPSLVEMSPSQVVMQARWPPWPQPWHQVQRAEPLSRGTVKGSSISISDSRRGSVGTEDCEEWFEVVSESGSGLVRADEVIDGFCCSETHSEGGSRLTQIEHGA